MPHQLKSLQFCTVLQRYQRPYRISGDRRRNRNFLCGIPAHGIRGQLVFDAFDLGMAHRQSAVTEVHSPIGV
jgi:hypothetical protein